MARYQHRVTRRVVDTTPGSRVDALVAQDPDNWEPLDKPAAKAKAEPKSEPKAKPKS